MKRLLILLVFISSAPYLFSQKLQEWHIQNHTFLDNREFFNSYTQPQTIFGSRLGISAGFNLDSVHSIQIGANFLYEFGSTIKDIAVNPIIYYKYDTKKVDFIFGAFPRYKHVDYPRILHNDTLAYYRPNIEGAVFKLKLKKGYQKIWIDWTSRQSEIRSETFMAGTLGRFDFPSFFFENYFYMYHHAGTLTKHYLRDNAGGLILFGIDSSKDYHILLATGLAFSDDRVRPNPFKYSLGLYNKAEYYYKHYIGRLTHYFGKGLSLAHGDPYFKANNYLRFDAEANFIQHKNVDLQLKFSFHFTDEGMDSSQLLKLIVYIDGNKF